MGKLGNFPSFCKPVLSLFTLKCILGILTPHPPRSWQHPKLLKLNIDGEDRNCIVPVPAIKTGHWCLLFFSFRNTHCLGKPFLK